MIKQAAQRFITATVLATVFWGVFFYLPPVAFSFLLLMILLIIILMEWKNLFRLNDFWFWFIMPWYPILPFALLIYLNSEPHFRILITYLFVTVFSFDSMAYITGVLLGSHKIIPQISPGKTIEGCIGGFFGALISFYLTMWYDHILLPWYTVFILVFTICLFAFLGDIFESFLKRNAHIKDSGNILPGHGGFLDRFDAVIMVTYLFFFFRHELVNLLATNV